MIRKRTIMIYVTFVITLLLIGCEQNVEGPNENPGDNDDSTNSCKIGFNEQFDVCVDPLISVENFAGFEINIDDEYNLSGNRMVTNMIYNYISKTLDFDVSFMSEVDIKDIELTVNDVGLNKEIYSERLLRDPSSGMNLVANDSFYDHIHIENLERGKEYRVIIKYTYMTSNNTVSDRVLSGFTIDTTSLANVDVPVISSYELLSTTTDSLEIKFKVLLFSTEVDALEIRLYDAVTDESTGISKEIANLEQYREPLLINIPTIVIDGLKSNSYYNIRIYGSGSNEVDVYSNVLLFIGDVLDSQQTDKFFYDRDQMHFFHFDLDGLTAQNDNVLLSYTFTDKREELMELINYLGPVYLRIKNQNGYDILEVILDTGGSSILIPQNIYDEAKTIEVYYKNTFTKQYKTMIIFGVDSIPVE